MNSNMIILIGVGALAIIGGAVLILKSRKGKKKNIKVEDFDEDYDEDYGNMSDEDNE